MNHEQLIERLQGLDGPDREVDLLIMRWVQNIGGDPRNALHYTASIDAALTLVPDGWKLRQMNLSAPCADDRKWWLNLYGGKMGEDTFTGSGATPAIAIVIAALRARGEG